MSFCRASSWIPIGDGCIGKGLPDHRDTDAVHFAQREGFEYRVTEIGRDDVVRDKIHTIFEWPRNQLLHTRHAVGEFPVTGHHVHTKLKLRGDHVCSARP